MYFSMTVSEGFLKVIAMTFLVSELAGSWPIPKNEI